MDCAAASLLMALNMRSAWRLSGLVIGLSRGWTFP
jgi:hypothetical protein